MFYSDKDLQVAIRYPVALCKPIKLIRILDLEVSSMHDLSILSTISKRIKFFVLCLFLFVLVLRFCLLLYKYIYKQLKLNMDHLQNIINFEKFEGNLFFRNKVQISK